MRQKLAAELLDVRQSSVSEAVNGRVGRGPVTGALELLAAVWPLLSPEQQAQVRADLARRRSGAIAAE